MLQVDLQDLSDYRLTQLISEKCSEFGAVKSIKICRVPSPFVMVEMATHQQTYELAIRYGGSAFGSCALIHLEQEPH
jgi:hypothetical protein